MADIDYLSPASEVNWSLHIKVLSRATGGTGVVNGNRLAPTSPASMSFTSDAGRIKIDGTPADTGVGTGTISTAHPSLPRIDIIIRDTAGAVQIVAGTPAVIEDTIAGLGNWHQYFSPLPQEAVPAGAILGAIYVAAGATEITADDIWMFAGKVEDLALSVGNPGLDSRSASEKAIKTALDSKVTAVLRQTITNLASDVASTAALTTALATKVTAVLRQTITNSASDVASTAALTAALAAKVTAALQQTITNSASDVASTAALTAALAAKVTAVLRQSITNSASDVASTAALTTALAAKVTAVLRQSITNSASDVASTAALTTALAAKVTAALQQTITNSASDVASTAALTTALAAKLGTSAQAADSAKLGGVDSSKALTRGIEIPYSRDGVVIPTGVLLDFEIPFKCTITAARLVADQTGSIAIAVWKDTYANFPPTAADLIDTFSISSATKSEETGLALAVAAGSWIRLNVNSCASITRFTLSLTATVVQ